MKDLDKVIEATIELFDDDYIEIWNQAVLAKDPNSQLIVNSVNDMDMDERLQELSVYDMLKTINREKAKLSEEFYALVDGTLLTFNELWDFEYFDWRTLLEYHYNQKLK